LNHSSLTLTVVNGDTTLSRSHIENSKNYRLKVILHDAL